MAKASGWGSEDRGFKSRYPDIIITQIGLQGLYKAQQQHYRQ